MRGRMGRLLALFGLAAWALTGNSVRAQAPGAAAGPITVAPYHEGPGAIASFGTPSCGMCGGCGAICQTHHCPPPFYHCQERPPVICIKCGCPRPVCNPCVRPNFGYFQSCWIPWPLPPDWSHCPVPPPAAFVQLGQPPQGVPPYPHKLPPGTAVPSGPIPPPPGVTGPSGGSSGAPTINPPIMDETFPMPRPMVPPAGGGKLSQ